MGLTTPLALLGLLGVVLPILAHFVKSRDLPLRSFPAVMLLIRASHARRRQTALADRWLLALRVLAIAALALGLAGPAINLGEPRAGTAQDLIVILDDSLSMRASDDATSAFERAKAALRAEVSALSSGSGVALVLAGQPARLVLPAGSPPSDVAAALGQRTGTRGGDMPKAFELARRELGRAPHGRRRLLVLSDMARHSGVAEVDWSAAHVPVTFFDARGDADTTNRRIVSVRSDLRGAEGVIQVSAMGITSDTLVTLNVGDRTLARGVLTPGPDIRHATLHFTPEAESVLRAAVRIEGDDALPADDVWPLWLRAEPHAALLIVDHSPDPTGRRGEASFVARALQAGQGLGAPSFRVVDEAALRDIVPGAHSAVILAGALPNRQALGALRRFVEAGGGLWVAPSASLSWRSMNRRLGDLLPARLRAPIQAATGSELTIEEAAPELRAADFEGASLGPALALESLNQDARVWFRRGTPLLVEGHLGRGRVFLLGLPLDDRMGDFPYQPGYLPMVLQVCARLIGEESGGPRVVPAGAVAELPAGVQNGQVETPQGELLPLPADGRFLNTGAVGLYSVRDASGPRPSLRFAVVTPTAEGDLRPGLIPAEIDIAASENATLSPSQPTPVAPWCYLFAGLVVAAEGILRASRLSRSAGARR